MFCNNSCCRSCCSPICSPCRTIVNNICPGLTAAEFNNLALSAVVSGSTIPLSNTVFNNASSFVSNNNGLITLTGPGLFYVSYSVLASNATINSSSALVGLSINGVVQPAFSAQSEIGAGESETLSNSTLISVPNGSSATFNLSITSDETLSLLPNVVIIKLS